MQEKLDSVKVVLERVKYNATHNREFDVYAVESAITTLQELGADMVSEEMVGITDALVDIIERKYANSKEAVHNKVCSDYDEGTYDAYDCIVDTTEFKMAKSTILGN